VFWKRDQSVPSNTQLLLTVYIVKSPALEFNERVVATGLCNHGSDGLWLCLATGVRLI